MGSQDKWGRTWTDPLVPLLGEFGERFILMLDDYYLCEAVDATVLKALEDRPFSDAQKIDLSGEMVKLPHTIKHIGDYAIEVKKGNKLIEVAQTARYRTSLQAAIWDGEYFKGYLGCGWTPWDFELHGEKRAINDGAVILGTQRPILKYRNMVLKGVPH
jgi:hypothetical protein